jgi:23S rRNA (adenine2503-C2)-methyltransferase
VRHILDVSSDELAAWLARHDLPGYRAGQIRRWLFQRTPDAFDEMTDLAKPLRTFLAQDFRIWSSRIIDRRKADDATEKLLLELADGERIECVLLSDDRDHHTICISTQVGCAMGCSFCASGIDGVVRNLTTGEIIEQTLHLKRLLNDPLKKGAVGNSGATAGLPSSEGGVSRKSTAGQASSGTLSQPVAKKELRLTHVVVMGMGEPLANLDALLPALDSVTAPDGLGISARRITISTVGLPKPIRRLADENCRYHLAVSLHAADDELRNQLVAANRKTGIQAILAATDDYFQATGRRVTFEYVLLSGVNDGPEHADRLVALLKGRPALVNVIPFNPVADLPYRRPSSATSARFVEILERAGLNVTIRYRKGDRIDAACGQLRRSRGANSTT